MLDTRDQYTSMTCNYIWRALYRGIPDDQKSRSVNKSKEAQGHILISQQVALVWHSTYTLQVFCHTTQGMLPDTFIREVFGLTTVATRCWRCGKMFNVTEKDVNDSRASSLAAGEKVFATRGYPQALSHFLPLQSWWAPNKWKVTGSGAKQKSNK